MLLIKNCVIETNEGPGYIDQALDCYWLDDSYNLMESYILALGVAFKREYIEIY